MSDKLFIDLWGATISADGIYAIGAYHTSLCVAVVTVELMRCWPPSPSPRTFGRSYPAPRRARQHVLSVS